MFEYTSEQAAAFEGAYSQLKKAKIDENYISRHREQILGAEADGVSDSDLLTAMKAAYPNIQVTRHTLKRLREQWASESALPVVERCGT